MTNAQQIMVTIAGQCHVPKSVGNIDICVYFFFIIQKSMFQSFPDILYEIVQLYWTVFKLINKPDIERETPSENCNWMFQILRRKKQLLPLDCTVKSDAQPE